MVQVPVPDCMVTTPLVWPTVHTAVLFEAYVTDPPPLPPLVPRVRVPR